MSKKGLFYQVNFLISNAFVKRKSSQEESQEKVKKKEENLTLLTVLSLLHPTPPPPPETFQTLLKVIVSYCASSAATKLKFETILFIPAQFRHLPFTSKNSKPCEIFSEERLDQIQDLSDLRATCQDSPPSQH